MAHRRTEDIAIETLYGTGEDQPGLLNELLQLTSGKPTTADLEEALNKLAPIAATLRVWVSSRHLLDAATRREQEAVPPATRPVLNLVRLA